MFSCQAMSRNPYILLSALNFLQRKIKFDKQLRFDLILTTHKVRPEPFAIPNVLSTPRTYHIFSLSTYSKSQRPILSDHSFWECIRTVPRCAIPEWNQPISAFHCGDSFRRETVLLPRQKIQNKQGHSKKTISRKIKKQQSYLLYSNTFKVSLKILGSMHELWYEHTYLNIKMFMKD